MTVKIRWWVPFGAIVLAWALTLFACNGFSVRDPSTLQELNPVLPMYGFSPPPIYQTWLEQVQTCATILAMDDTSFTIEHLVKSVNEVSWFAIPTEREDGAFILKGELINGIRMGPIGQDSILLSGQQLGSARLVKHELMHIIVQKGTEWELMHGRPWGLCEYLDS
jgi:hypothetical protein